MRIPKKWEKGEMICGYRDFEIAVRARRMLYVQGFYKGRPLSAIMVANMSYSLVTHLITHGRINIAHQRDEYRDWLREELLGPQPEPFLRLGP